MSRIAIFIDGGYLDKVTREAENIRIDFQKLSDKIADGTDRLRTYYYHCLPYQSNPPTEEEKKRFSGAQKFFYALERNNRFQVKQGRLAPTGISTDGRPLFTQKRVDVMFAVDLVQLSTKRQITEAGIIASDSDFLPAIEVAKNEGVLIKLYNGEAYNLRPHHDLHTMADERIIMDKDFIDSVKMK
jgi:uncharacterized LabA/DUF88 family protein